MSATAYKAVVTGGAGFIGGHLVERLLVDGCEVVAIDDFSGGAEQNLAAVLDHPRLALHRADVTETDAIGPLFEGAATVFHLAALADIVPSIERPQRYLRPHAAAASACATHSRYRR